jgi:hypothetical protein
MIFMIATRGWQAGLRYWHESARLEKVLFVSGTLLFVSMLVHGVVLFATGGSIHGPVSFRKAMTFAETGWLLCWAVGWLLPLITMRRWERGFVAFGALLFGVGETFLMSTQVWRGVPSHYNFSTPFDAVWFAATGVIAVIFTGSMLVLLAAALRERRLAPSLRLSIQVGTMLIIFGVVIGSIMIANMSGIWEGAFREINTDGRYAGPAEGTVGGDLVLLHAIGVHGLNLVPLVAWLLTYSHVSERGRTIITVCVAANLVMIVAVLSMQVFSALPLSVIDPIKLSALVICGLALLLSYAAVGWWALRGLLPTHTPAYDAR